MTIERIKALLEGTERGEFRDRVIFLTSAVDTVRFLLSALDAKEKELQDCLDRCQHAINGYEKAVELGCQAIAQRDTAREALRKFGQCLPECESRNGLRAKDWPVGGVYPCTCGFPAALAQAGEGNA